MFSGTSALRYSVEILQEKDIKLGKPAFFKLSLPGEPIKVFQFIPTEDICGTHLDVTVTSESDDIPAYMKVSRDCKDVKDNIDVVEYKGESLRLSFTKKGRITLSKFSIPPLTASKSSWFIRIAIKNASGDTPINAKKTGNLTLQISFDYSYAYPICVLSISCLVNGLIISLLAWFAFTKDFYRCSCWNHKKEGQQQPFLEEDCESFCNILRGTLDVIRNYSFSRGTKTFSYITVIVGSVLMVGSFQFVFADWYLMTHEGDRDHCFYNDFCYRVRYADIPYNLMVSNVAYVIHGLILATNVLLMESQVLARCKKLATSKKKTRADRLQVAREKRRRKIKEFIDKRVNLLIEKQKVVNLREEEEEAVQNNGRVSSQEEPDYSSLNISVGELPTHLLKCPDISLHLEEMLVPTDKTEDLDSFFQEAIKKKYSFSLGYALAWALCFEGMFSALYHLCPSKLTFQFDSAFMFVIAGLSVILLYNDIQMQHCAELKPVGGANFFLFFLVPLLIFNYLGTVYHSEAGLAEALRILFIMSLFLWLIILAVWVRYKLFSGLSVGGNCITILSIIGFLFIPIVLSVAQFTNLIELPDFFLYFCVTETVLAALGSCSTSCRCQEQDDGSQSTRCCGCCCKKTVAKYFFTIVMIILLIAALRYFAYLPTTDKTKSPEQSRDLNEECLPNMDFFDYHDLWLVLSSHFLIMWALMVILVRYKPPDVSQLNKNKRATNQDGANERQPLLP